MRFGLGFGGGFSQGLQTGWGIGEKIGEAIGRRGLADAVSGVEQSEYLTQPTQDQQANRAAAEQAYLNSDLSPEEKSAGLSSVNSAYEGMRNRKFELGGVAQDKAFTPEQVRGAQMKAGADYLIKNGKVLEGLDLANKADESAFRADQISAWKEDRAQKQKAEKLKRFSVAAGSMLDAGDYEGLSRLGTESFNDGNIWEFAPSADKKAVVATIKNKAGEVVGTNSLAHDPQTLMETIMAQADPDKIVDFKLKEKQEKAKQAFQERMQREQIASHEKISAQSIGAANARQQSAFAREDKNMAAGLDLAGQVTGYKAAMDAARQSGDKDTYDAAAIGLSNAQRAAAVRGYNLSDKEDKGRYELKIANDGSVITHDKITNRTVAYQSLMMAEKGQGGTVLNPGESTESGWNASKPQQANRTQATSSNIPVVRTEDDYKNVPSGSEFLTEDGVKRRKR